MEKTEKIKVHGTSSGKLYINPFDLFSLEKVQELINKIANQKYQIMTEKKSVEEILDKLLIERGEHPTRVRNPLYWEERQLAKDFAAQELAEYKARLKKRIADWNSTSTEEVPPSYSWKDIFKLIDTV